LGYSTAMYYLPEQDATIVVEANQDNVEATVATAIFVAIANYLYPAQSQAVSADLSRAGRRIRRVADVPSSRG
jgi:hypothetical protein